MPYELPPILSGSTAAQLRALRDYLVRLAGELENAKNAEYPNTGNSTNPSTLVEYPKNGNPTNTDNLRSLVVKTADTVRREVEKLETELHESYLALSDFGLYTEQLHRSIESTARETVESFELVSRLESVESESRRMNSRIVRGIVTDPETGARVTGIAISESLSLSGAAETVNGETCWELSPGQSFGLYTASGWQFWINGSRRGWFDSVDGMLHTDTLRIANVLQLGDGWQLSHNKGLGIRKI